MRGEVILCLGAFASCAVLTSVSGPLVNFKRRANLSCMDVKEIVSLACSHRYGRAPRLSGWKKMLA